MIEVEDVWFSYDTRWILKGINLKLKKRRVYGIVGPIGSGKTTLAKHFNALLKPTRGRVLVDGLDTRQVPQHVVMSKVGYVFQNPCHQLFCSSVEEELKFAPKNFRREPDMSVAEFFSLHRLLSLHPFTLSTGQMEKLAIASVASYSPEAIILDEPTLGADEETLAVLKRFIHHYRERGNLVVVISHDVDFVLEVADEIIGMKRGRVEFQLPNTENVWETVRGLYG